MHVSVVYVTQSTYIEILLFTCNILIDCVKNDEYQSNLTSHKSLDYIANLDNVLYNKACIYNMYM